MNHLMTSREAEERWGLDKGTIRSSCGRGRLKDYIEKELVICMIPAGVPRLIKRQIRSIIN
jgi:hypothetical protein